MHGRYMGDAWEIHGRNERSGPARCAASLGLTKALLTCRSSISWAKALMPSVGTSKAAVRTKYESYLLGVWIGLRFRDRVRG